MTGEPRILTGDDTYLRRAQRAANTGPKTFELCAWKRCARVASWGPFCGGHRQPEIPSGIATVDLTTQQTADLQAQVEADAAPLFLIAMNWITAQQLDRLGATPDSLAAAVDRISGELDRTTNG